MGKDEEMRKKNPRIIKNIGVTGTGPGCGSTTVAAALAYYHGKHNQSVCFTEIANPIILYLTKLVRM